MLMKTDCVIADRDLNEVDDDVITTQLRNEARTCDVDDDSELGHKTGNRQE